MKKLTAGIFTSVLALTCAFPALAETQIATTQYVESLLGYGNPLEDKKYVSNNNTVNRNIGNLNDAISSAYDGSASYNEEKDAEKLITAGAVMDVVDAVAQDFDNKVDTAADLSGKMLTTIATGEENAGQLTDVTTTYVGDGSNVCDDVESRFNCSPMLVYGADGFEWVRVIDNVKSGTLFPVIIN